MSPPRSDAIDEKVINRKSEKFNNRILEPSNSQQKEELEPLPIVWFNVYLQVVVHSAALYGAYLLQFAQWKTIILAFFYHMFAGFGITMGAHRLWAHRSYKARLPLRIVLGFLQTTSGQNSIKDWCRDHRVHHKHVETNADPHNSVRGFFFAHMGWLMTRKHEDVKTKGAKIPLDDLMNDPVVYWQHKFYIPLVILCNFIIPTFIPTYFWNENIIASLCIPGLLRYVITLHVTWCVNSFAHLFGEHTYDERINPAENIYVSMLTIGEGFHNYHHVFPNDYATSEWGGYYFNYTRWCIDFMCFIGQAYDRKKVDPELILGRRKKHGDLSHGHGDESIEHAY
jgi:stearoyl-CoA desaturase (delta-9 desaturase)